MRDPDELLPFCLRCFGVGAVCDDKSNFCHQCGSEGTCTNMKRSEIEYLKENIQGAIDHRRQFIYTEDDCRRDTTEHIRQVQWFMSLFSETLLHRARVHDRSKLETPELEIFTKYTPRLKHSTYGSDEYKGFLESMGKALKHHYKHNSHHPEHFEDGVRGMNLLDVVEMFCDWKAATMRHENGDIRKSIQFNQGRFDYSDDLRCIFENTVSLFE